MRIESPIIGLARVSLSRTAHAIERSLARLSTGREVNSPRDNVAAYSFGVTLESQIRGLRRGTLNANEAQSVLMKNESILQSQLDLVQRMRELAIQASNGVLSASDRDNLNTELQSLISEFQRNSQSVDSGQYSIQFGADRNQSLSFDVNDLSATNSFKKVTGTGAFALSSTFVMAGGVTSRSAIAGDLNNDGNLDTVLVGSGFLAIYLGDGEGSFSLTQSIAGGSASLQGERLSDVNGDGILDLIGHLSAGTSALWLGNGDGTFDLQSTNIVTSTSELHTGDFNGDGLTDVVGLNSSGVYSVALNDGEGNFTTSSTFFISNPASAVVGDLNGDGTDDIASIDFNGVIYVQTSNSSGAFSLLSTAYTAGGGPMNLQLQDANNDGDLDLYSFITGKGIYLNQNNGSGAYGAATLLVTETSLVEIKSFHIEDFNGDGQLDFSFNDSAFTLNVTMLANGQGTYQSRITLDMAGTLPFIAAFGDYNNDGASDMVVSNRGGGAWGFWRGNTQERTALVDLDLRSQSKSQTAIGILDNALGKIQEELSRFGSLHNRLDSVISSNLLLSDSLEEAKSRSLDADIASETAELVRNQILQQAQVAVLAQANSQMQIVLNLLR